jgi:hypothetical protein
MTDFKSLLPPNRTAAEEQLEQAHFQMFQRLIALTADSDVIGADNDVITADALFFETGINPDILRTLYDTTQCPVALLPWLAWTLSADEWDDTWSVSVKRQYIADSFAIHKHKGTPFAIKKALQAIGYDNVIIRESSFNYYNGVFLYDSSIDHGSGGGWPLFDVILNIGYAPDADKIAEIKTRINRYKNKRSVLRNLYFMTLLYNNTITYDGTYQHGGGYL